MSPPSPTHNPGDGCTVLGRRSTSARRVLSLRWAFVHPSFSLRWSFSSCWRTRRKRPEGRLLSDRLSGLRPPAASAVRRRLIGPPDPLLPLQLCSVSLQFCSSASDGTKDTACTILFCKLPQRSGLPVYALWKRKVCGLLARKSPVRDGEDMLSWQ